MRKDAITTASEMVSVLGGSWRPELPRLSNDVLEQLAPLLSKGGAAALAWFSIRQKKSELSESVADFYYKEYVISAVRGAAHEADLERLLKVFSAQGIRCILLKGWSVARLYPQSGLRPCGDIDLWVHPEQRRTADAVLRDLRMAEAVDLEHDQLRRFKEQRFEEFYPLCETANLAGTSIRVPRREDQVRILCFHFLKHGGWKPIWLCDIAVLLEKTRVFDWDVCLTTNSKWARWIGCTIALARELFTARVPDGGPLQILRTPPKWVLNTVLREWIDPLPPDTAALALLLPYLCRPQQLKRIIAGRWRNPIQATVDRDGRFNELPHWPYQLTDAAARAGCFLARQVKRGCSGGSAGLLPCHRRVEKAEQVPL